MSPAAAVGFRLLFASLLFFGYALTVKKLDAIQFCDHVRLMFQGFFLYGADLILVYSAIELAPSGLIAVVYSTAPLLGILLERAGVGRKVEGRVLVGGVIGVVGIALVAVPPVSMQGLNSEWMIGEVYAIVAVVLSSFGALHFQRHAARVEFVSAMAWGMAYGGTFALVWASRGTKGIDFFWGGWIAIGELLYLTLVGSLIGFGSFLYLVREIGLGRAAYTGILAQVIAVLFSALRGEFGWGAITIVGIVMCLSGNVLVLYAPSQNSRNQGPAV